MRERYVGKCPFQIVVNQHLIHQGYTIIFTSSFTNRLRYSRYLDDDKTLGQIRCGGFDTVMYDKEECLIGAEVKPEFSWNEFQRALGQVIAHPFWRSRVEEGMIIMPLNRFGDTNSVMRKKKLIEHFTSVLENCGRRGYHVSMKYLAVPCKIVNF
jgi:hypothetical protein